MNIAELKKTCENALTEVRKELVTFSSCPESGGYSIRKGRENTLEWVISLIENDTQDETCGVISKNEDVKEFIRKLNENEVKMPEEIQRLVNENYFDLL